MDAPKPRRPWWRPKRWWAAAAGFARGAVTLVVRPARWNRRRARAWADMADVPRLGVEALAAQGRLLAAFDAGELTPDGLADGIEREALPRWSESMRRIENLGATGVSGKAFDLLAAYVSARREASELLVKAFRYRDAVLYDAGMAAWAEAGRVGRELRTVRDSIRAARRGEGEAGPAAGSD